MQTISMVGGQFVITLPDCVGGDDAVWAHQVVRKTRVHLLRFITIIMSIILIINVI